MKGIEPEQHPGEIISHTIGNTNSVANIYIKADVKFLLNNGDEITLKDFRIAENSHETPLWIIGSSNCEYDNSSKSLLCDTESSSSQDYKVSFYKEKVGSSDFQIKIFSWGGNQPN